MYPLSALRLRGVEEEEETGLAGHGVRPSCRTQSYITDVHMVVWGVKTPVDLDRIWIISLVAV